ncbi:MAG: SDR family oxidoreductase [Acidaminococcaceae bacterium]|nr:SDR family oxidoreductase [Acidaminococcaceae bacterium]
MDLGLKDKVVAVTGGTSGIGRSVAEMAAAEGARVFVLARHEVQIPGCRFLQCDVTRPEQVGQAVAEVVQEAGRIDVLVNSAGVYREEPLEEVTEASYREIMDTNVLGTVLMCRAALPHMDGGCIVNVASDAALRGNYGCAVYAASKGAVVAFTKSLALDVAPRVRVNAVCPGDVDTPMMEKQCREGGYTKAECGAVYPLQRIARPEEAAFMILSVASPRNGFMTGAAVEVTGGL